MTARHERRLSQVVQVPISYQNGPEADSNRTVSERPKTEWQVSADEVGIVALRQSIARAPDAHHLSASADDSRPEKPDAYFIKVKPADEAMICTHVVELCDV